MRALGQGELLGLGVRGSCEAQCLGTRLGSGGALRLGVWEPGLEEILVLFWIECTRTMQFYLMETDNFGQNALLILFYSFPDVN